MHSLERKLIDYGIIDATVAFLDVDSWFENATLTFKGKGDVGLVTCKFIDCYEISLSHDKSYSKGKTSDGKLDYKYFIQDIEIKESDEMFELIISAWPLKGKIVCKKIILNN